MPIDASVTSTFDFDEERVKTEVAAELYQWCEERMAVSKERVPVKHGHLRSTGKVEKPVWDGNEVSVTMGYGGPSDDGAYVDYAGAVHEMMDSSVHWTTPGTGPKYLENPIKEDIKALPGRLGDGFKRGLK